MSTLQIKLENIARNITKFSEPYQKEMLLEGRPFHNPYYVQPIYSYSNNYYNYNDNKTKKEDNKTLVIWMFITSIIATFFFATDDYLRFARSNITSQIKDLYKNRKIMEGIYMAPILRVTQSFQLWRRQRSIRTIKPLICKIGAFTSIMAGLIAAYFGYDMFILSISCLGISLCYWLWSTLTSDITKEQQYYDLLVKNTKNLYNSLQLEEN